MRYFFVDTENISDYSFIKEMNVSSNDTIVLFMSENAGRIKLEDLKAINASKVNIIYEDIYTGEANALDFQLIALLTLNLGSSEGVSEYIVVSNDNGYKLPVKYLKEKTGKSITILKTNNLTVIDNKKILNEKALPKGLEEVCEGLAAKEDILKIIGQYKTLSPLHNKLRQKFGDKNGREIYMEIKPYVKSLYKS